MQMDSRDLTTHKTKILLLTQSKLQYTKPSSYANSEHKVLGVAGRVNSQFCLAAERWSNSGQRMTLIWVLKAYSWASAKWKKSRGRKESSFQSEACLQAQELWGPARGQIDRLGKKWREMILETTWNTMLSLDCIILNAVGKPRVFKQRISLVAALNVRNGENGGEKINHWALKSIPGEKWQDPG